MVATPPSNRRFVFIAGGIVGLLGIVVLPNLDKWFPVPCKGYIGLTENRDIIFTGSFHYSQWSTSSRIDLIDVDKNKRFILGVGSNAFNDFIPDEKFIIQDGSAGTFVVNFSEHPDTLKILNKSIYGISTLLKKAPRVFIIGVGGGSDVWAAKFNGAQYIKGIELNRQILDIHRGISYSFSKDIVDDPDIELI